MLERVGKRFASGSTAVEAVADVSLTRAGGEVVLLLGQNGAGKSTLLRMIAGLIEPSRGEIRIGGRVQRGRSGALLCDIGWCSSDERSFYPRLSGRENLRLFAALHGLDRGTADARIDVMSFGLARVLERPFQTCSTGERQKLNLLRALLHEPRLLLLDEPARSLDAATRRGARARAPSVRGRERPARDPRRPRPRRSPRPPDSGSLISIAGAQCCRGVRRRSPHTSPSRFGRSRFDPALRAIVRCKPAAHCTPRKKPGSRSPPRRTMPCRPSSSPVRRASCPSSSASNAMRARVFTNCSFASAVANGSTCRVRRTRT